LVFSSAEHPDLQDAHGRSTPLNSSHPLLCHSSKRQENLTLYRKKLSDPKLTERERPIVEQLLAQEEANEANAGKTKH
jgi:hypothetical protein